MCCAHWRAGDEILSKLPVKFKRTALEQQAAAFVLANCRSIREDYLLLHATHIYKKITHNLKNFVRLEELVFAANALVPGLTVSRESIAKESEYLQSQKEGLEINQGIFLAHVLADPECGLHLCHTSLLPHPRTHEYAEQFAQTGQLKLEGVSLERRDKTCFLQFEISQYLNAEDDKTLANTEIAADLAILDPKSSIVVMRGSEVREGKYAGKRVFCSGINLTRLYNGKIPYLWYLERDMGIVNKIYRGVANTKRAPSEMLGQTTEKLWIAAVDQFAIGGGCQYLLVTDINIAAKDAYMTLPARKEGIIPGLANLRLPRFVGDRIARQAIMMEKRIECDSPEGRMICDYVVDPQALDATIEQTIQTISASGVVSASGNRKSFRIDQEPLDHFRKYMSVYAREQSYCHFSEALISNLERNWDAHNRKLKEKGRAAS
jgi:thioesterase DpgC